MGGHSPLLHDGSLPRTMRAIVFQEPNDPLVLTEKALPELLPGRLLVRIIATSVCASDFVPWKGYLGRKQGLISGHEAVGVIVKVNGLTGDLNIGDNVGFINVLGSCGLCVPCLGGHTQYCETGKLNPGFSCDGYYAEYTAVEPSHAVKLPESLPIERLSPLFCAGITAFSAVKKVDAPARGLLGVFGLGGVGTFAVRFATAMGFAVVGFDVSAKAREAAMEWGASEVVDSSDLTEVTKASMRITGGKGLDGSIVCAGVEAAYAAAIEATGFSRTVVAVGVPHSPISLPILPFILKGLVFKGTQSGNPLELREMMAVVERFKIIPEVEFGSLEDIPSMFAKLADGKATTKMAALLACSVLRGQETIQVDFEPHFPPRES